MITVHLTVLKEGTEESPVPPGTESIWCKKYIDIDHIAFWHQFGQSLCLQIKWI